MVARSDASLPSSTQCAPLAGARVLVVSHGFQQNYEQGFTNGLAAAGAQPVLIGSDRTDPTRLANGVTLLNLRGSQDASRPRLEKARNLVIYHYKLMVMVMTHRQWTVHVIGLLDPVVWVGILQGAWIRLFARRYVLTVHNIVPHDRDTAFNRVAYRLAYRMAHALVVHTQRMADQLVREFGVETTRIVVMEHGIEPVNSAHDPVPQPREAGPLQLLCFGVVHRYKGLDLLLSALEHPLPPFRLQIVGMCKDARLREELEAQIATHRHRACIDWTCRFVDEAEVPDLLLQADVLVMPYRHIDQSGVLFQALRYGLPVIATDVGSFKRYVTDEVGIVCESGSVPALVQAIGKFAQRRGRYSAQRIRALARTFEWPSVVLPLASAYHRPPSD